MYQIDNSNHLSVKGRGNSWKLHPTNTAGGAMATYTVGADGTVAFYEVTTINQDKDKDPLATINLRDIIKYVNDQNAVSQIKSRAQQIHVKQPVDANSEEDDE